ncbi:DUF1176 domain-containing protein [Pectobacterium atrosepticum]|uniref:DUF1176 domain-containing protein n=1 Tax=Pectobacterium atrosepticum TaxID=29471 RepID=UPI0003A7A907|nr:DUF1176 domain-containing protein [Pectobacterium atrosepticum]GKV85580.1 hypothetical protein PEC301296_18920 [Pectobacterium carotovorum subsp. carotovorum]AIA69654.1 hypothetical protein EV46_03420 [Pectobacterium atrosepticum]AIK12559.1 putative exported protein [Pectobacterium atrosepticum]ATY89578.1 DUF1176 domain-containing protein [Pectobacterium atrosepticum]KFX11758.1 hypothetical protein JV34_20085 [Pectobacterium atrosepticum]
MFFPLPYRFNILSVVIASIPTLAFSTTFSDSTFFHKDWEIVCDNTLTCRAAGYSPEEKGMGEDTETQDVSLLITRHAGQNTPITAEVTLAEVDKEISKGTRLTLAIDGVDKGALTSTEDNLWQLNETQIPAVLQALKGSGKVAFLHDGMVSELSGAGAYAVLLKMDERQGRIGATDAITKKGNKSSELSAVTAPVIYAAATQQEPSRNLTNAEQAAIQKKLLKTLKEDDCYDFPPQEERVAEPMMITPLNGSMSLLSTLCWRAAYNEGYAYWVIDNAMQTQPQLVTTIGVGYENGEITAVQKGRGLADCMSDSAWVWDGKTFQQSRASITGSCRMIRLGGTWDLPYWTATVIRPGK